MLFISAFSIASANAQEEADYKYERPSLYCMMIENPGASFNEDIKAVYQNVRQPERFNDHSLGVKTIMFGDKRDQKENIDIFLKKFGLAKKMVARWFKRDKSTGVCNMELIKERGNYNATVLDVNAAKQQIRGLSILEDAGEDLISHTYLVMNNITYANKNTTSSFADNPSIGRLLFSSIGTSLVDAAISSKTGVETNTFKNLMENMKGFKVHITSYLYRLKWENKIADEFYGRFYTENPDDKKIEDFNKEDKMFQMEYVGKIEETSSGITFNKETTAEQMLTKILTRALDKNIAELQHNFSDFRIKAPITSTSPIKAYIGMKEDVTEKSKYEVLERIQNSNGKIEYKRVGIVRPVKNKIWDNRYMASEEDNPQALLNYTEFEKVSGGDFYPGMLLKEL